MEIADQYDQLYSNTIQKIRAEGFKSDPHLNSLSDDRYGITLLIRPPLSIKNKIQEFLEKLKEIDREQYYYPTSDIHVTVLSIISCYDGFRLEQISVPEYIQVIEKSIQNAGKFNLSFKGITASPSGVMIQGFPEDDTLNHLRDTLRENFRNSGLEHSIDKRYRINTAHATVLRFRKELIETTAFLELLENFRKYDFGEFTVDKLELVYNDWYQHKENVKKLHLFKL